MQLSGQIEIAASRRAAWDVLTDPHRVAECVPGEPQIEFLDDRNFRVTARVGNAMFQTNVTVEIEVTDMTEPESATAGATAAVMGGPVNATGRLELDVLAQDLTRVTWSADLTLGGMLVGFAGMVQAPVQNGIDRTLESSQGHGSRPRPAVNPVPGMARRLPAEPPNRAYFLRV